MSKRKALSADEKRTKLLEIFHESGDVFQLKELEKLAPKEKGIVQQSVKPVLQELVDGGLVRAEKISGSIFYWAFQSDCIKTVRQQLHENEDMVAKLDAKIIIAQQQLQSAAGALANVEEIKAIENEIAILNAEKIELQQRLAKYSCELDHVAIKAKQQDTKRIQEAANRWTDNIFSIKTWCKKKFAKEDRELDKAFGIPEDLDYVDT